MPDLTGVRVLVVEDEGAVAFMIEEMLEDLGCVVAASVASLPRAEEVVCSLAFDAAVLDVNLAGATTFDLARDLGRRRVPYVFSTGYGSAGLPPDLRDRPVLTKPFGPSELHDAIKSVLSSPN
jgi:CheY-like chemotaxis protein